VNRDLARAIALGLWVQERTSSRIEPFRWGRAFFNDDLRERYFSNFVRCEKPLDGVEVGDLLRETDVAMSGLDHRQIQIYSGHDGARIAPQMTKAGYTAERTATLALRREPDRPADLEAVSEVEFSDVRSFLVEVYLRFLPEGSDIAQRFADFRRTVQLAVGTRFFAQRIDGKIAGLCELYVHDGVAQIEHVDTLEEFRGRNVARNVVLRAAHEGLLAGADLICLDADADDWPIQLYRRFGFDEISRAWVFTRPANHSAAQAPRRPA
jgi:ribosomal protein S18 acetylase RimI-like enzyme